MTVGKDVFKCFLKVDEAVMLRTGHARTIKGQGQLTKPTRKDKD